MTLRLLILLAAAAPHAWATHYQLPSDALEVIGELRWIDATFEDTFVELGREHGLGYDELIAANPGIDPWLPGENARIVLPKLFVLPDAPRNGIVLNLAEMRLYFFPSVSDGSAGVQTYPVSVGRIDADTPTGTTTVIDKVRNPVWYPPQSIIDEHAARGDKLARIVEPGPDNPLGTLAMQLGLPGYLIHGTNMPAGIGMRVTHGCIRLLPDDIDNLFEQVPRGTPVHIVNQPYKMGWVGDTLFLEVHRPFSDDTTHVDRGMTAIVDLYVRATSKRKTLVDWDVVESAYEQALGVPIPVNMGEPGNLRERLTAWCDAAAPAGVCNESPRPVTRRQ